MEFGVLGPLEVRDGPRSVDLGGLKQRAVLAVLLVNANRVVSLDRMIDELWGDEPPSRATGSLQAYISNLRRALEPSRAPRAQATVLVSQAPGYVLRLRLEQLDAARFEELAGRGRRLLDDGLPDEARPLFDEALRMWRGAPLAEFAFEPFAQAEIARLVELRAALDEDRVDVELALGHHGAAAAAVE
jgi:DNA-binding SARP family transcriptional activator